MRGKNLKQLLSSWQTAVAGTEHTQPPDYNGPDVTITKLTEHTSQVDEGACFVARVREGSDGHPYISKAISNGAGVILAQRPAQSLNLELPQGVVYLQVPDTAIAVAWLAAAWESFPSHDLVVVGITGTDGKTSTANILFSIMKSAGLKVGLLSTIKAVIGDIEEPLDLHVTTPEAPVVQHYLRRMVERGLTHCIVESTSHGLAQYRVGAIEIDLGVVTNITHEHLDYHGSYDRYFAAKARLFEWLGLTPLNLPPTNHFKEQLKHTAVLNLDDSSYRKLANIRVSRQISYGLGTEADVSAVDILYRPNGTDFALIIRPGAGQKQEESQQISSELSGKFNIHNMLAAAAAGIAVGLSPVVIKDGLQSVQSISGRMEGINMGQSFHVVVDFAHTPNALDRLIESARQMVDGRIITVFGSAGKRDVQKRRLMAEISARKADLTILTAEDPRTESLDEILDMMAEGCKSHGGQEGKTFWRFPDRGLAIYEALMMAEENDIVLICGKGHEQSMCFGVVEYPWDDRQATREALKALLNNQPMIDLGLPTFQRT